jgi:hypothetical protein
MGVECRLWGSKYGVRLYLRYSTSGTKMYTLTATTITVPPLAVTTISPVKKKNTERCKNVCKVWTEKRCFIVVLRDTLGHERLAIRKFRKI